MKHSRRASSLRVQIFIRTFVVGLVPLALLAVVAVLGLRTLEQTADRGVAASRQSLASSTVTARLQSESEAAAREIDLVLVERINDVVTWSRQPSVIEGSEAAAQLAGANGLVGLDAEAAEARFAGSPSLGAAPLADAFLAAEMERRGQFVDISFTDRNGFNAGVVGTAQDFVQSDEAWWQSAWDNGIYVGGVTLHPESNQYVIPISSRIENAQGTRVGVLRASLSLAFVQTVADAHTDDDVDLVVITAARQLLAETATGHDQARIGSTELTDADFSSGVLAALDSSTGTLISDDAVFGFTRVESTRGAVERDDQVDRFDWFIISSQPTSTAFAPLAGLEELNADLDRAGRQLSWITLIVVVLSCIVAAGAAAILSRKLVRPIKMLTERARRAAEQDLPSAVARMQDNTELESFDETTIEISTGSELHELASSFNSVQRTAISLAAEQARQRKTTADMFANLGRRNQSLVKRQLRFIEKLEQSEEDPDRLSSLFRLDHLATRMRRNAESLLVIAGHRSATRRTTPVRIELVAQAALGEVEGFERVNASAIEPAALLGRTVADVAHVLAELVENALSFSPPEAPVAVTGKTGPNFYTLSVIDRGIGLTAEELVGINERLSVDAGLNLTSSKQLGLLVVSKLAARHELSVRLVGTNAGGISAEINIPNSLIQASSEAPALPAQGRSQTDSRPMASTGPVGSGPAASPAPATPSPTTPRPGPAPTTPTPVPTATPLPATPTPPATPPVATPATADTQPVAAPTIPPAVVEPAVAEAAIEPTIEAGSESESAGSHHAEAFGGNDRADTGASTELQDLPDAQNTPEASDTSHDPEATDDEQALITGVDDGLGMPSTDQSVQHRRKDDLSPVVADSIFRAPGLPLPSERPQESDDPAKQRRVTDSGFAVSPVESSSGDADAPVEWDAGLPERAVVDGSSLEGLDEVAPTVGASSADGPVSDVPASEAPGSEAPSFDDGPFSHPQPSDPQPDLAQSGGDGSPDVPEPGDSGSGERPERYIGSLSSKSVSQISTVRRRESRRPIDGSTSAKASGPKSKRSVAITDSAEEVSQEAEKLRDRWSSFQRGRREATPDNGQAQMSDEQHQNDEQTS